MKNQYFGDINDYRKYGLLRAISRVADFRTLVVWMLTPNDGGTDGKFTDYLYKPTKWSRYDPSLYAHLCDMLRAVEERSVENIKGAGLLKDTDFFSKPVPDNATDRDAWFVALSERSKGRDFVFLDPDNGLEVKSKPYGRKHSSKYLFWREVALLWESGSSLLIYQHFIREKRVDFIQRMLEKLNKVTADSFVEAFSTSNVVFLLALQPRHRLLHGRIVESVQESWADQIEHWELTCAQQAT